MKFFRNKFGKKVRSTEPRIMPEINKEYSELIGKVGQAQYQAYAYKREVDRLNRELERVNLEATERTKLDNKAAEKTVAPPEADKAEVSNG